MGITFSLPLLRLIIILVVLNWVSTSFTTRVFSNGKQQQQQQQPTIKTTVTASKFPVPNVFPRLSSYWMHPLTRSRSLLLDLHSSTFDLSGFLISILPLWMIPLGKCCLGLMCSTGPQTCDILPPFQLKANLMLVDFARPRQREPLVPHPEMLGMHLYNQYIFVGDNIYSLSILHFFLLVLDLETRSIITIPCDKSQGMVELGDIWWCIHPSICLSVAVDVFWMNADPLSECWPDIWTDFSWDPKSCHYFPSSKSDDSSCTLIFGWNRFHPSAEPFNDHQHVSLSIYIFDHVHIV